MSKFYRTDADLDFVTDHFWAKDREKISALGGRVLSLDEANRLDILRLFDFLNCHDATIGQTFNCLPAVGRGLAHVPLPFSYEHHDEIEIGSTTLEKIVEDHVNSKFTAKKYLFLCIPTHCIAIEFSVFRYDIIHAMSTGWMNDWILICDETLDQGFLFCEDGCLNLYTRGSSRRTDLLSSLPDADWIQFFNENFQQGVPHASQGYLDFVNLNFGTRIPGLSKFVALAPDASFIQQ